MRTSTARTSTVRTWPRAAGGVLLNESSALSRADRDNYRPVCGIRQVDAGRPAVSGTEPALCQVEPGRSGAFLGVRAAGLRPRASQETRVARRRTRAARQRRSGTSLGPSEPAFPASGGPALVPPAGALVGLLPLPRGRSRPAAFGGSSVAERSAVNRLVVGSNPTRRAKKKPRH